MWLITTSDYSGFLGVLIAVVAIAGSVGAAWLLIKANSARQNLTIDQTAFARAQLMQDTLERENNNLQAQLTAKTSECTDALTELKYLREIIPSRALLLNGFEAQGVPYEKLIAPRPSDAP